MTLTTKILLIIIGVISISAIGFIIWQQHSFSQQALQIQNSVIAQQQLLDNVVRSQSQYVNQKGFEDFIKQNQINIDDIQKNIKDLGGQISAINVVQANSTGQTTTNVPSTNTIPVVNPSPTAIKVPCDGKAGDCVPDPFHYYTTTQNLKLSEDFGKVQVPIGQVGFTAGSIDNKPWNYTILPRTYTIDNTVAYSSTGQTTIYNQLHIKSGDESFTVPITSSNTVELFPESSFSFWNPKGSLGFSGAVNFSGGSIAAEATPSLSVSIMSYGKTKTNPDLRILSIGPGYNMVAKKLALEVSPIQFNVAKMISGGVINNTYIGPTLGVNTVGGFQVGLGVQVGL